MAYVESNNHDDRWRYVTLKGQGHDPNTLRKMAEDAIQSVITR